MKINELSQTLKDFEPQASGYSKLNALFLGEAAAAADGAPEEIQSWARRVGFSTTSGIFIQGKLGGFVGVTPDMALVSFCSRPPTTEEWLAELRATPESAAPVPGRLHHGVRKALRALWSELRPQLTTDEQRAVWITGHGLGGALAVACAAQTTFEEPCIGIRAIYTFGQPRCGDEENAEACERRLGGVLFRHINDRDSMPRLPLFVSGYRHWGTAVYFNYCGQTVLYPSSVESLAAMQHLLDGGFRDERALQQALDERVVEPQANHSMENYLQRLREQAQSLARGAGTTP